MEAMIEIREYPKLELDEVLAEESDPPLEFDEDEPNLVPIFVESDKGRAVLKEISQRVLEDFEEDWDGSSEYRDRMRRDLRLFTGDLPQKNWPFQHAANAHVPILSSNIQRLQCRIESEVFGDWSSVMTVVPVGPDDEDMAEILTQHALWQMREQIQDFPRQAKRGIQMFLLFGDVTCHSYYDPVRRQNCHDMLTADEFVTPFAFVSTQPDYSDLDHYTKILRYNRHQLKAQKDKWYGVDAVLDKDAANWDSPGMPLREAMAEVQGEEIPTELSKKAPFVLLQYEGWFELPGKDRDYWCQVIVDKATERVLSLQVYEEVNWQDRIRFEQQAAEMAAYREGMLAHVAAAQQVEPQAELVNDLSAAGELGPQQEVSLAQNITAQIPPPPPPPLWLEDPDDLEAEPEPPRKDPIRLFAHAVCIEPMTGSYGLSYGRMLADYNRAANTALSQFTDSATLSNAAPFIAAGGVEFERPFSFSPARINKIKGIAPGDIDTLLKQLNVQPANPQLLSIVELMVAYGQEAAQAPDVLSGNPGKSGETYRGIATRVEQATKNLTVIARVIAGWLKIVFQNNAKLNSVFLPDEEIFEVTQGTLKYMAPMKVTREMYQRNYRVRIVSDLQFQGDAERIARADQVLNMTTAFPFLGNDIAFAHRATTKALEARGLRDMVEAIGPQPPNPQTPFGVPPPSPPGMMPPGAPPPGAPPAPQQAA